jgi:hypothetical protein
MCAIGSFATDRIHQRCFVFVGLQAPITLKLGLSAAFYACARRKGARL